MRLFKKKVTGKEIEKSVKLRKTLLVQNYTPTDYATSVAYAKVLKDSETYIGNFIKDLALDDQSAKLLQVDNMLDSIALIEKNFKNEQRENHMYTIVQLKNIFQGELVMAEQYRDCLKDDLQRYEEELAVIKEMQKQYGNVI